MKKNVNLLLIVIFTFVTFTAKSQVKAEYEKIDTQVELLLDSAAKHMLLFVLSKDETHYATSINKVSEAEKLNAELEKKVGLLTGTTAKIEKEELEGRKEEILDYHDDSLKELILKEADKDRTEPIKFHGKSYKVGKTSKSKYDVFIAYLPRN